MKRLFLVFILLTLLPVVSAELDITGDYDAYYNLVGEFVGNSNLSIVKGEHISKTEYIAFTVLKETFSQAKDIPVFEESEYQHKQNTVFFLIGGPMQNTVTKDVLDSATNTTQHNISLGVLTLAQNNDGKYIIVSDKVGYNNVVKDTSASPLSNIIPTPYVPVAATALSLSFMWLLKLLLDFGHQVLRKIVSGKVLSYINKKKPKKKFLGFKAFGIKFKLREWISVLLASLVFGIAFSWSFISPNKMLLSFLLLNFTINLVVYGVWFLARLIMDKIHKIETEFVFWHWGGLITIISGWLGNAFSLAGYNVSHTETKEEAGIYHKINLCMFIASIIILIVNIFNPSQLLQLGGLYTLAFVFIDMLPMNPFSGKLIKEKKPLAWYLTFIPMVLVYILVNLIP